MVKTWQELVPNRDYLNPSLFHVPFRQAAVVGKINVSVPVRLLDQLSLSGDGAAHHLAKAREKMSG